MTSVRPLTSASATLWRDPHLRGALLVRTPLVVDDPQGFVFLDEQHDGIELRVLVRRIRAEGFDERLCADAAASTGSRHEAFSLTKRLSTYVDNIVPLPSKRSK